MEDTIILNISKFDRGPLDPKNIEGIVLDVRNNVYQIGTPAGVIKNWCSREELHRKKIDAVVTFRMLRLLKKCATTLGCCY